MQLNSIFLEMISPEVRVIPQELPSDQFILSLLWVKARWRFALVQFLFPLNYYLESLPTMDRYYNLH